MNLNVPSSNSNEVIAYCINLDRRPDRWQSVQEQWKKFSNRPQNLIRVKAVDTGSLIGCAKSHQLCIDHAKRKGLSWILVLEDDVVFKENARDLWKQQMKALAERGVCDIFRSGLSYAGNITKLPNDLFQFQDGSGLFFTLYFQSCYDTVLSWLPNNGHIDRWLSWNSSLKNLTAVPFIASTLDGQSDIRNKEVKDSHTIEKVEQQLLATEGTVSRTRNTTTLFVSTPDPAPAPEPVSLVRRPSVGNGRKPMYQLSATMERRPDGKILRSATRI